MDLASSVLARTTFDDSLAPLGERVVSVANRVRGSDVSTIVQHTALVSDF